MKRLLVTILAILYMGTSTGATIHMHYCMGKLVDMKLWHTGRDKCGNCGMKKSKACAKKCCKDEHKLVKLEKDHRKAAENILQSAQMPATLPAVFIQYSQPLSPSVLEEYPVSHAPPLSIPIHIFHCTLRI